MLHNFAPVIPIIFAAFVKLFEALIFTSYNVSRFGYSNFGSNIDNFNCFDFISLSKGECI